MSADRACSTVVAASTRPQASAMESAGSGSSAPVRRPSSRTSPPSATRARSRSPPRTSTSSMASPPWCPTTSTERMSTPQFARQRATVARPPGRSGRARRMSVGCSTGGIVDAVALDAVSSAITVLLSYAAPAGSDARRRGRGTASVHATLARTGSSYQGPRGTAASPVVDGVRDGGVLRRSEWLHWGGDVRREARRRARARRPGRAPQRLAAGAGRPTHHRHRESRGRRRLRDLRAGHLPHALPRGGAHRRAAEGRAHRLVEDR